MRHGKHLAQSLVPSSRLINVSPCSASLASTCKAPLVEGQQSGIVSLETSFLQQGKVLSEPA